MRGLMKGRRIFVSALVISIFMGFVGLACANTASTKSVPEKAELAARAQVNKNYGKLPLSFIRNDGQLDENVQFYERGSGHNMYFTGEGVYLELISSRESESSTPQSPNQVSKSACPDDQVASPTLFWRGRETIKLSPIGANRDPEIVADNMQEGKVNYLIGNKPEKWKTNIPTYGAVVYKDVYKDIDIKYYGNNRQMEYDVIVKPGADYSQVQFQYDGIKGLNITDDGRMEIAMKQGKVVQNKPYCYQEINGKRVEVAGRFKLLNSELPAPNSKRYAYSFEVASYNRDYSLVIDPVLVYSTFLGGSHESGTNYGGGNDRGYGIAVDGSGCAYITGYTYSSDYPTMGSGNNNGPYDDTKNWAYDAFVTKLNDTGSGLVYSTFLGGTVNGGDYGNAIAVDNLGHAYVVGITYATTFPTTTGAGTRGNGEAFVSKLLPDGSGLAYSTLIGGGGSPSGGKDECTDIAVDNSGNAYVVGYTSSQDFPTTTGAYDTILNNGPPASGYSPSDDIFVTKLDTTRTDTILEYSTFLGGTGGDIGYGITIDGSANAYVTGLATSTDFPTSTSAFDASYDGGTDAVVAKLDPTGSTLLYSTYLGESGYDRGLDIVLDSSDNVYVLGYTNSTGFPTTVGSFDITHNGVFDIFITKLDTTRTDSTLEYSTFLGGTGDDRTTAGIALDSLGNAYVAGYTLSADFPTTADAFDITYNGDLDVFITKLDSNGANLEYSTYLGGGGWENCNDLTVDSSGDVYVTGQTNSVYFPTTSAYDTTLNGDSDAFVTKFSQVPVDNDGDGYYSDVDCDDSDAAINPGATEVCDLVDNNCDGQIDEGLPLTTYYQDSDGDGYGDLAVSQDSCSQPEGYVIDSTDCDDTDANEHPGQTWYQDSDFDGYGDPDTSQVSCTQPGGYVINNTDCDDGNSAINPGTTEICNGEDDNCNGLIDIGVASYSKIESGQFHNLGLKSDGTLWAWGANNFGQLGDGTTTDRWSSVQIGSDSDWVAISAGNNHSLGLKSNGTLWAWGRNNYSQLGDVTTTNRLSPVQVGSDNDWVSIAAGEYHSHGLKSNGTLWAWGYNWNGQLGDGTTYQRYAPVQVGSDSNWALVTTYLHTLGLKTDGTLWAWGRNNYGQLGDGTTYEKSSPVQVGSGSDWILVSLGRNHSVALKNDGTLWAWGNNTYGQLGDGTKSQTYIPVQAGSDSDWSSVAAKDDHTLALKTDGTLWAWGRNDYGQLGDSSTRGKSSPAQIGSDNNWESIAIGQYHSLGLKTDGALWAWGNNTYGQLGDGTTTNRTTPGTISKSLLTTYYQDSDGDGYGNPIVNVIDCTPPAGYVTDNSDCNDTDANEHPGQIWFKDTDNDGYSDGTNVVSCTRPTGHKVIDELTAISGDCDDSDATVNPGVAEVPNNGIDDDCNPSTSDTDADNDGVPDADDQCPGFDDSLDADGDGVADGCDQCSGSDDNVDVDIDGIPDGCDSLIDSDGDGIGDNADTCPNDAGNDADNDGVCGDVDNCPAIYNPLQENNDGDLEGDFCDTDDDNDGYSDTVETTEGSDPLSAASKPADNDGDFDPDSTDTDDDNDGVLDTDDAFPFDANETTDSDGDGIGDNADTCPNDAGNDADNDGVCGDVDNCPAIYNPLQENNDGDSEGDACDTDDDNDGIVDTSDTYPFDNDNDGVNDSADTDFTEPGTNVVVEPVDTNPVSTTTTLTFDNIEESGTTTVTSLDDPLFPPPSGFMLSSETHFEIETTATFTDTVTLCITYADAGRDGGDDSIEDTYKLFHYDESQVQWVDITTSLDTVNNVICGKTTSFSPFAVFVDTEVLTPLIEGAIAGGGQSSEVDSFLRYTSPGAKSTSLPVGTTDFDIGIVYGDTINAGTFQATLNGVPFDSFNPGTGETWETVSIPLEPGRNVLVLKVEGAKASGRTATDTDRLVFIVK